MRERLCRGCPLKDTNLGKDEPKAVNVINATRISTEDIKDKPEKFSLMSTMAINAAELADDETRCDLLEKVTVGIDREQGTIAYAECPEFAIIQVMYMGAAMPDDFLS